MYYSRKAYRKGSVKFHKIVDLNLEDAPISDFLIAQKERVSSTPYLRGSTEFDYSGWGGNTSWQMLYFNNEVFSSSF
jgi:hypothetical protein